MRTTSPLRFQQLKMLLEVERGPGGFPLNGRLSGWSSIAGSRYFGLFFCHSAMIGLAWRKQSTPTGMPQ